MPGALDEAIERMRGYAGSTRAARDRPRRRARAAAVRARALRGARAHGASGAAAGRRARLRPDHPLQRLHAARPAPRAVRAAGRRPAPGLVLDLRGNPGGVLESAVGVADDFLETGLIVRAEGRAAGARFELNATDGDLLRAAPLVVLVDRGSASGAEIVAGALRDHGRATLMGERTFGKGSVQTVIPLRDGQALKLTTSEYFTPSGVSIHERGLEPDVLLADDAACRPPLPRAGARGRSRGAGGAAVPARPRARHAGRARRRPADEPPSRPRDPPCPGCWCRSPRASRKSRPSPSWTCCVAPASRCARPPSARREVTGSHGITRRRRHRPRRGGGRRLRHDRAARRHAGRQAPQGGCTRDRAAAAVRRDWPLHRGHLRRARPCWRTRACCGIARRRATRGSCSPTRRRASASREDAGRDRRQGRHLARPGHGDAVRAVAHRAARGAHGTPCGAGAAAAAGRARRDARSSRQHAARSEELPRDTPQRAEQQHHDRAAR